MCNLVCKPFRFKHATFSESESPRRIFIFPSFFVVASMGGGASVTDKDADDIVTLLDASIGGTADGEVDEVELEILLRAMPGEDKDAALKEKHEVAKEMKKLDKNGDGKLSRKEVIDVLKAKGLTDAAKLEALKKNLVKLIKAREKEKIKEMATENEKRVKEVKELQEAAKKAAEEKAQAESKTAEAVAKAGKAEAAAKQKELALVEVQAKTKMLEDSVRQKEAKIAELKAAQESGEDCVALELEVEEMEEVCDEAEQELDEWQQEAEMAEEEMAEEEEEPPPEE